LRFTAFPLRDFLTDPAVPLGYTAPVRPFEAGDPKRPLYAFEARAGKNACVRGGSGRVAPANSEIARP